jgi:hypothetical protein
MNFGGIKKRFNPLAVAIVIAFLSGGCFTLWSASLTALAIFLLLFFVLRQNNRLALPISLPVLVVGGAVIAYGLAVFYAVDRGMAFLGFVKMTAVAGFLLLCCQMEKDGDRKAAWDIVPLLGGFSVAVCLGGVFLSFISGESYFFQDGRLGGFLGYANTYALWLLLGLVITAFREQWRRWDQLIFALNLCGICLSISRSLALITLATLILLFILRPAARRFIITITICGLALGALIFLLHGMQGDFTRLLQAPGEAGEWLSRLAYYRDGLSQIAARPVGWGYLGYWYSQTAYQSVFYDVRFIHCSVLQYALDIGIIPALLLAALGAALIISKRTPVMEKIILALICGHSLIDIDLEFLLLFFLICLTIRPAAHKTLKPAIAQIIIACMILLHLYAGLTAYAAEKGPVKLALALYPWHTDVLEQQMMNAPTLAEAAPYAQKLLQRNDYAFLALDTLARVSYSQGHNKEAALLKLQSLSISRFLAQDYLELLTICADGYELALSTGDEEAAEFYRQVIVSIPQMIERAAQALHKDAYRLKHKPDLQLPQQILEYIYSVAK